MFDKSVIFFKLILLISTFVISPNSYALDYEEEDKQLHIGATAIISGGLYLVLREKKIGKVKSALAAFFLTMTIAYIKEKHFDQTYSNEDMEANAVGSAGGVLIPIIFTF